MSSPSPVAHLCTATTWRGGEQQALYLAEGMQAQNLPCFVIAQPGSPMAERSRAAGLEVEEIRCRGGLDVLGMWKVSRALSRRGASLIHAHDAHAVSVARVAGWMAGVHRVCTRRVDFPIRSRRKYVRGMERVICISEAIRAICQNAGMPESMLPVVYSGIDLDRVRKVKPDVDAIREEFAPGAKTRPLLLLNVASLTDHKGQTYLLDAMPTVIARVPQTVLVIAGEGELRADLERQANRLALDEHCVFAGFREDVPELLGACDLFVMPSHLEGLCTSVMDAMAAGRAVVVTDAGGMPELVDDGVSGRVVPARDPEALGEVLAELLHDRKRREKMAKAAGRAAGERFGKDAMVRGTLAVYAELVEGFGA